MTRLQQESNAVLNALDEGKVVAVIALFETGQLLHTGDFHSMRDSVYQALTDKNGINMEPTSATYWLDYFNL